ncbi:MAG: [protein-PII] uridylyltransferase [Verrucomicrobia bacterium]|nr:[protein-PII] uridylyltransferase [Verrucomicrobiota bacterium]
MSESLPAERLASHIERELAAGRSYPEAVRVVLDEERDALLGAHRAGGSGVEIVRRRAATVDEVVRHTCGHWVREIMPRGKPTPWCLVAIGGYGRRELSPHSDLDLVFVSSKDGDGVHQAFNERIVHTLWDAGCQVGHAFRTVEGFLDVASDDVATKTSLLEMRLIAGDETLFDLLRTRAHETLFAGREGDFLDEKIEERRQRHAKFGETLYLQEPNIKESIGGLRDLHTVLWVVQALHGTTDFGRMREIGLLDLRQQKSLEHALDFYLRVRTELHFIIGRPYNVAELTHQPAIAAGLGIGPFRGASADEHLMRLYYFHARNVSRTTNLLLARLRRSLAPQLIEKAAATPSEPVAEGFTARDGMLEAADARVFRCNPVRLIEAFALAQERGLALHPDLQLLIRSSLALLDGSVRTSGRGSELFVTILGRPGRVAAALRQMHELGVLGRYLPEFGKLTCLVQHDMHHRFTIDEHTLRSLGHLDDIVRSHDPGLRLYRQTFHHLAHPHVLALAVLLHDVGKPIGPNHAESGAGLAWQACVRLRLDQAQAARVEFLVRHHLLLPHTAFRRDLSDAKVIRDVSAAVGSLDALRQLLLLSVVDIRGTAPELWSEWKEALLWDLFGRCKARLQRSERTAASKRLAEARRDVRLILSGTYDTATLRRLLEQLPQRLFQIFKPGYIARLARLPHELGDGAFVVDWAWNAERRVWDVAVCTRDRHALFASLAGVFAVEEVNILDAYIHTLEGGVVLDVFRVAALAGRTPIDQLFIDRVDDVFEKVLARGVDVEKLLARATVSVRRKPAPAAAPEIHFNNTASDRCTLIEVRAADRVGLLHDMLRVLSDGGLDIQSSVISTDRHLVFDVFYVVDERGRKLRDKKRQHAIREPLHEVIAQKAPYASR